MNVTMVNVNICSIFVFVAFKESACCPTNKISSEKDKEWVQVGSMTKPVPNITGVYCQIS